MTIRKRSRAKQDTKIKTTLNNDGLFERTIDTTDKRKHEKYYKLFCSHEVFYEKGFCKCRVQECSFSNTFPSKEVYCHIVLVEAIKGLKV